MSRGNVTVISDLDELTDLAELRTVHVPERTRLLGNVSSIRGYFNLSSL